MREKILMAFTVNFPQNTTLKVSVLKTESDKGKIKN